MKNLRMVPLLALLAFISYRCSQSYAATHETFYIIVASAAVIGILLTITAMISFHFADRPAAKE